jgi:DNA-binding response OmpR family regulator
MSGLVSTEALVLAEGTGIQAFLTKPFGADQLLNALELLIGGS